MSKWVVTAATVWVLLALAGHAYAGQPAVPEIDGSTAITAVGLLAGAVTLLAERLRRK